MKMWIGLPEAIRMVMSLQHEEGEQMAAFATYPLWAAHVDDPSYVKLVHGPEAVELLPRARDAFYSAMDLLKKLLPEGKIRGEGLHEDIGLRAPITESEWSSRYIDFWDGQLENPGGGTRRGYPWITEVEISFDDLRLKLAEAGYGTREPKTVSERKRHAVRCAIRDIGRKTLATLHQKKREAAIIEKVRDDNEGLSVSDTFVRSIWHGRK
ncbi:MAG: hypothetical protein WDN46_12690 [Methylocella sp.]